MDIGKLLDFSGKGFKKAALILEDGMRFNGNSIGADGFAIGEVVFNTSITGYQEIISDPSYSNQLVTLTYPHVGNVGCNSIDMESFKTHLSGLIIKQISMSYHNHRAEESLQDFLRKNRIVGIENIDTRKLTLHLRKNGAKNGIIVVESDDIDFGSQDIKKFAQERLNSFPGITGKSLIEQVSGLKEEDCFREIVPNLMRKKEGIVVIVYDLGVKRNIVMSLKRLGCSVKIVDSGTKFADIKALGASGIVFSNGPGDPEPCTDAIKFAQLAINDRMPCLGICLGHQIISLALGGKTVKMSVGHHGANHPVVNLKSGKIFITSQNHGFVVDEHRFEEIAEITHRSLFDGTIQGYRLKKFPVFAFQGHPEGCPGPQDIEEIFVDFLNAVEQRVGVFK
ncbi:glutamine-hydrolyzing carbamoyl-phosphate synthase small subunit [Betaproteobacteria bacterium]|nr:glutamine-hydrolyzing carbamoyl-phosphate synthase small subunit [Betaproteobacteria bacterium]